MWREWIILLMSLVGIVSSLLFKLEVGINEEIEPFIMKTTQKTPISTSA
jgi:hypothetical protein